MLFLEVMFTVEILSYLKRLEENLGPVYLKKKKKVIWIASLVLSRNSVPSGRRGAASDPLGAGLGPRRPVLVGIPPSGDPSVPLVG